MWPAGWTLPTPDLVPGKQFQKSQMATPGEGERERERFRRVKSVVSNTEDGRQMKENKAKCLDCTFSLFDSNPGSNTIKEV